MPNFFRKWSRRPASKSSHSRHCSRSFRPSIEPLEARQLLAVNVVADLFDVKQGEGAARLDVLANDQISPDHAGAFKVTSVTAGSEGGQIQIIEDGAALSYLPPSHFHGIETFQYSVDGQDSGSVTIDVLNPVRDDNYEVFAGTGSQTFDVLSNDPFTGQLVDWVDYPGDGDITIVGRSLYGAEIEIAADGKSLIYTPDEHRYGRDSFDYIVDDLHVATVSVELPTPLIQDRDHLLKNDGPTSFNVIANDLFYPGYSGARQVTHILDVPEDATAEISADGQSVVFAPAADFQGYVNLRYVVDDAFEQTLSLRVVDPVRSDYFTVDSNSTDVVFDPLENDYYTIYDGTSSIRYDVVDRVTSVEDVSDEGGTVTVSPDGLTVRYTPPAGFSGTDYFAYIADDKYEAHVQVAVTQPVRYDSQTVYLGDVNVPLNVLENDFIGNGYTGDKVITGLEAVDTLGTFTIVDGGKDIIYTPPASFDGYNGFDQATYEVDGEFTATVSVYVYNPVHSDYETIPYQQPTTIDVLSEDSFGQYYAGDRVITSVTQPENGGQVEINGRGDLVVTPGQGTTQFTYTVDNNDQLTATVTVNYANWLRSDYRVTDQNTGFEINVIDNDFDVDSSATRRYGRYTGDRLITGFSDVTPGAEVTVAADGQTVTYTPAADFVGADSFTYTVDGYLQSTMTVQVVRRVEDDVFHVLPESSDNVLPVMVNDLLGADYEGASHITSVVAADAGATVSIGDDLQSIIYTPSADSSGEDTLTYKVDGKLVAEVEIQINDGQASYDQFGSEEALGEYLIESALERFFSGGGFGRGGDEFFLGAPVADGDGKGVPFSDTNTQVNGVDEADVVENDGQFLYTIAGSELVIAEVAGATTLGIASQTPLEGSPVGMYLNGDRLTVISEYTEYANTDDFCFGGDVGIDDGFFGVPCGGYGEQYTFAAVYDVGDRANPVVTHATRFDGSYIESRRIDNTVFVITDAQGLSLPYPEYEETTEDYVARMRTELPSLLPTLLPQYTTFDAEGEVLRSGLLVAPEDLYTPITEDAYSLLTVSSIDMGSDQAALLSTQGVLSNYGTNIYASLDNLYVFAPSHDSVESRSNTEILQFAWNAESGAIDFAATGQVPGAMNDQFSADEFDGHLRIATTVRNSYSGNFSGRDENTLFVLQEDGGVLESVGSLNNLALNESIQSVRFAGEQALVVTFRRIDPIFGIDLSEHANPHVVGSLSLPGFSTYQQFIDEDHILTVGQNASGGIAATAVSLFNVSDLANPLLVDQVDFPRGATSIASADHHAFGWFAHHSMLSLPSARYYSVRVDADGDGYKEANESRTEHELFSYRVDLDADDQLSLLGAVTEDSVIQRAAFVGDTLYTIAHDSIQSSSVNDPAAMIDRIEWELQPVEGGGWLPIDVFPEAMRLMASSAAADLAVRLEVDESAIMRVTSEDGAVVLRTAGQQYLYESGETGGVELVDSEFEFSTYTPSHNVADPLDVNNDGFITPVDAIIAINELNDPVVSGVRSVSFTESEWYTDTTGDGLVAPLDAIRIINRLNARSIEPAATSASVTPAPAAVDVVFALPDADDEEE